MPNAENLRPFKQGKDARRNTDGRPKGSRNVSTILRELLEKAAPGEVIDARFVKEFCKGKKKVTNADAVAARLLKAAIIDGEAWAIKELADRTEGKAKESLEVSGKDGGPMEHVVTQIIIQGVEGDNKPAANRKGSK